LDEVDGKTLMNTIIICFLEKLLSRGRDEIESLKIVKDGGGRGGGGNQRGER
jgi:hypothetical protein